MAIWECLSLTASTSSAEPGVWYSTIGTSPRRMMPSGVRLQSTFSSLTAKAVQYKGWQWTTAFTDGLES